jgi:hypothetical protein
MQTIVLLLCSAVPWAAGRIESARQQHDAVMLVNRLGGRAVYEFQHPILDRRSDSEWSVETCIDTVANAPLLRDLVFDVIRVDLKKSPVSDRHLVVLSRLRRLENLDLSFTSITNAGLANIEVLAELRVLSLSHTNVDDAGMLHLSALTRLEELILDNTAVSDHGLVHLENLTALRRGLGLAHTRVTDAGLERLIHLTRLRYLNLSWTSVTPAAAETLKEALPGVSITLGSGSDE